MSFLYLYILIGLFMGGATLYYLVDAYSWDFLYEDFKAHTKKEFNYDIQFINQDTFKNILMIVLPVLGAIVWLPFLCYIFVLKNKQ